MDCFESSKLIIRFVNAKREKERGIPTIYELAIFFADVELNKISECILSRGYNTVSFLLYSSSLRLWSSSVPFGEPRPTLLVLHKDKVDLLSRKDPEQSPSSVGQELLYHKLKAIAFSAMEGLINLTTHHLGRRPCTPITISSALYNVQKAYC
mmetsp:Transcript_20767/g.40762  ORF Transcript_20767/g.40762 Transcript_20767/m.40762 type:complete len:153 (+) Transcript_20767:1631-2089(+)